MIKSLTSEKIELTNVRGSFLRLWKPEAFESGQKPKFQAAFLLDPSKAEHQALIGKVKAEAKKLLDKGGLTVAEVEVEHCFGLADRHPRKSKYEGYKGMYYVCAGNEARPATANRRGEPVHEGDPQAPYSGCYVNGSITLWLQNNKYGKKINANLRGVQFVADGEAFGRGPISAEAEFTPLDDAPTAGAPAGGDSFFD